MKLVETTLLENMVTLMGRKNLRWTVALGELCAQAFIASVTEFLHLVRSKEDKKVALAVTDIQGKLLWAAVVEYHEGETAEEAGNISYTFTFDQADLENARIYNYNDAQFQKVMVGTSFRLNGIEFKKQSHMISIIDTFIEAIISWADVNASENKETVELDGYFKLSTAIENGVKVVSMVPDGAMKQLVKDDKGFEN